MFSCEDNRWKRSLTKSAARWFLKGITKRTGDSLGVLSAASVGDNRLSGFSPTEAADKAAQLGADACFAKPIEQDAFLGKLAEILAARRKVSPKG